MATAIIKNSQEDKEVKYNEYKIPIASYKEV